MRENVTNQNVWGIGCGDLPHQVPCCEVLDVGIYHTKSHVAFCPYTKHYRTCMKFSHFCFCLTAILNDLQWLRKHKCYINSCSILLRKNVSTCSVQAYFFFTLNIFFLHSATFVDTEATDVDNWLYLFNIHEDYVRPQTLSPMCQKIKKEKKGRNRHNAVCLMYLRKELSCWENRFISECTDKKNV